MSGMRGTFLFCALFLAAGASFGDYPAFGEEYAAEAAELREGVSGGEPAAEGPLGELPVAGGEAGDREAMTAFWEEVYREFLSGKTDIPVYAGHYTPKELTEFRHYAYNLANSPDSDVITWYDEGDGDFRLHLGSGPEYKRCALRHDFAEKKIKELTEGLSPDEESVRYLWKELVAHAVYGADDCRNSCAGLLEDGVSRCHGMAMLFTKELEAIGIESYYVLGTTTGLHAWTAFVLDGMLYAADPAYAVCLKDQGGEERYFLSPDLTFGEDRTIRALY